MNNYEWEYGEHEFQTFYECKIGNDYLCVYANKWGSNLKMYMGFYSKNNNNRNIYDKAYNDRQRKKGNYTNNGIPTSVMLLGSENVEYIKKESSLLL